MALLFSKEYSDNADIILHYGDCLEFMQGVPDESVDLIITSPPYNMGKKYEKKSSLDDYLDWQASIICQCARILSYRGSICWQVGTFVDSGAVYPLDIMLFPKFLDLGLIPRNRIVWHFGHGLHCRKRFSGRHETILWFTKSDDYYFNLDAVRVPQKQPTKRHHKGPKKGQLSCNPLGKNPADVWSITNIKNGHPEKTDHPCQFPYALVERLILSMSKKGDLVFDPFMGSGTTLASSVYHKRRGMGCEIVKSYWEIAFQRVRFAPRGYFNFEEQEEGEENAQQGYFQL